MIMVCGCTEWHPGAKPDNLLVERLVRQPGLLAHQDEVSMEDELARLFIQPADGDQASVCHLAQELQVQSFPCRKFTGSEAASFNV